MKTYDSLLFGQCFISHVNNDSTDQRSVLDLFKSRFQQIDEIVTSLPIEESAISSVVLEYKDKNILFIISSAL